MTHSFDVAVAEIYGLQEAIILEHLHFWIAKNMANGVNYHDGRWWTYNSVKAFSELFPYMSASTINRVLQKLEEMGLVITGNYNKVAYDRTKWYALSEEAMALFGSRPAEEPKREVELQDEPAPVKKEAKQPRPAAAKYPKGFEEFWKVYPRNTDKAAAYRCYGARLNDGYSPEELLTAATEYASECRLHGTEQRYIKQAKTFLGPATPFVDYLPKEAEKPEAAMKGKELSKFIDFLEGTGG